MTDSVEDKMAEQLSEAKELNTLKERLAELEQDNRFLFEHLRVLEKRLDQIAEIQSWREEANNDRRHGYYGYW